MDSKEKFCKELAGLVEDLPVKLTEAQKTAVLDRAYDIAQAMLELVYDEYDVRFKRRDY